MSEDITVISRSPLAGTWRPSHYNETKTKMYHIVDGRRLKVNRSSLRPSEWEEIDLNVREAAKPHSRAYELFKAEDLIDDSYSVGTKLAGWEVDDRRDTAKVTINGDQTSFGKLDPISRFTTVPVIRDDFPYGWRAQQGAKDVGRSLATRGPKGASESVATARERMIFNGNEIAIDGHPVQGLLNAKGSLQGTPADFSGGIFDNLDAPHDLVLRILKALADKFYYGAMGMFVGEDVFQYLRKIHDDSTGVRLSARIKELEELKWIDRSIHMPKDSMLITSLNSNDVGLIESLKLQTRQYGSPDSLSQNYCVMTVFSTKFSEGHDGNAGIAHVKKCFG